MKDYYSNYSEITTSESGGKAGGTDDGREGTRKGCEASGDAREAEFNKREPEWDARAKRLLDYIVKQKEALDEEKRAWEAKRQAAAALGAEAMQCGGDKSDCPYFRGWEMMNLPPQEVELSRLVPNAKLRRLFIEQTGRMRTIDDVVWGVVAPMYMMVPGITQETSLQKLYNALLPYMRKDVAASRALITFRRQCKKMMRALDDAVLQTESAPGDFPSEMLRSAAPFISLVRKKRERKEYRKKLVGKKKTGKSVY